MVHDSINLYTGFVVITTLKELVENGFDASRCDDYEVSADGVPDLSQICSSNISEVLTSMFNPFDLAVECYSCCHSSKEIDGETKILFVIYEKGIKQEILYSWAAACRFNEEWMTGKKLEAIISKNEFKLHSKAYYRKNQVQVLMVSDQEGLLDVSQECLLDACQESLEDYTSAFNEKFLPIKNTLPLKSLLNNVETFYIPNDCNFCT